jgi:hypothetical protein
MIRLVTAVSALALLGGYVATPAFAASCAVQAADKKLAGAAQKSFMTKCARDAEAACNAQAAERKLAGAAKTSFTKKCITDNS